MDRIAIVHTPLGEELLFRSMNGIEAISSLFHYSVEMLSLDAKIDLNSLLGQSLSLQIKQLNADDHWLNGDITSICMKGMESGSSRYYVYQAEVRPHLWYLTQNKDFRIFQDKSVPEIIKQVLADFNIDVADKLIDNYRHWEYCVQYNESAFDFISRLMEHEGIYYYFSHQAGSHSMILADSTFEHQPGIFSEIPYRGPGASAIADEVCVDHWQINGKITPGFLSMDDYDFRKPYATMLESKTNLKSFSTERTELFDWPGRFIDRSHAEFYTRIRQQEKIAQQQQMTGAATTSALVPGNTIQLLQASRPEDNQDYLIIHTQYTVWDNSYASGSDADRGQRAQFTVIPAKTNWRSSCVTAWPKTQGPQTARVVCPPGETIWTDEYGRVKVKFHWDRYAAGDDTSSCWVRVSSMWAGMGYGSVQVPRLNDEVVIDFINGDPDRPLIIGRVYNAANMPPWTLPDNATIMGVYSRSKNGHKDTANILRIEDRKDNEEIYVQAQKNMDILVRNSKNERVNYNRSTSIGNDESLVVASNRTVTVEGKHDIKTTGNLSELIKSNFGLTVEGDFAQSVNGCLGMKVNGDLTLQSDSKITLRVGGSFIVVHDGGVDIKGPAINLNSGGSPGSILVPSRPEILAAAAADGTLFVQHCPLANANNTVKTSDMMDTQDAYD